MLLIAIVDDERSDSSALKALVDTYFQQNRQAYMIHVFNGALDFIRSTENHDISAWISWTGWKWRASCAKSTPIPC